VTIRKKKILLIQFIIFFVAIILIYFTYYKKNVSVDIGKGIVSNDPIKTASDDKKNTFENVEYKGLDLNGNRYSVNADNADFSTDQPELINMQNMTVYFYFNDSTILKIEGKTGVYNNKTFDMKFKKDVRAEYEKNYLFSDNLDYLSSTGLITIYGNVRGESIQGDINADKAVININNKTLNISMFGNNQVNVNLKDK
tara:strand:- start:54 stop:647 length:594 start_codon:yes stop_codon:yes gene_type:complete